MAKRVRQFVTAKMPMMPRTAPAKNVCRVGCLYYLNSYTILRTSYTYLGDQLCGLCRLKGLFLALPRLRRQNVGVFRYQNLLGILYIPAVCLLTYPNW